MTTRRKRSQSMADAVSMPSARQTPAQFIVDISTSEVYLSSLNTLDQLDPSRNYFLRGLLPEWNYRFVFGAITPVAIEVAEKHKASPQTAALMGEAMLGAFFLESGTSKAEALKSCLHLEGDGPVRRIISFAGVDGRVRAHAGRPDAAWSGPLEEGKGSGQLKVSRWFSESQVYTSSVEMRALPLAHNLEDYITRSDQIQAFVKLQSEIIKDVPVSIAGCMIQALPDASVNDTVRAADWLEQAWPHLRTGMGPPAGESVPEIHSTPLKVLSVGQFQSYCDCSSERVRNVLRLLGREDMDALIQEQGQIEVHCEFCGKRYAYGAGELDAIFTSGAAE